MPEIEIRPAISPDIPGLLTLDHNYTTDYVWQMEIQADESKLTAHFLEVRLPHTARVEYPRPYKQLVDDWTSRHGLLIALLNKETVGYLSVMLNITPATAWITDLVVMRRLRRQGIGSALVLAAQDWGIKHDARSIVLEMQPKNHPAIRLAQKFGFNFCGYNDRYYANHDIALFFAKGLH